jgi:hypothetical protein
VATLNVVHPRVIIGFPLLSRRGCRAQPIKRRSDLSWLDKTVQAPFKPLLGTRSVLSDRNTRRIRRTKFLFVPIITLALQASALASL